MKGDEPYGTLKVIVTILLFLACSIVSFASQSWFLSVLLFVAAFACAEYLGVRLFARLKWFNRLSVEHSGFSIMRVLLGVWIALTIVTLVFVGRLLYLRLVH